MAKDITQNPGGGLENLGFNPERHKNIDAGLKNLEFNLLGLSKEISLERDLIRGLEEQLKKEVELIAKQNKFHLKYLDNLAIQKNIVEKITRDLASSKKYARFAPQLKAISDSFKSLQYDLKTVIKKLPREMVKDLLRGPTLLSAELHNLRKSAQIESAANIQKYVGALDRAGIFGKVAKLVMRPMLGAEGSEKRAKIVTGAAALAHPELFPEIAQVPMMSKLLGMITKMAAVWAAIGFIVAALWDNFRSIQAVSANLVVETGSSTYNVQKMADATIDSSMALKEYGINLDDLTKTAGALTEEFKNIDSISKESVETITVLSKRTGISASNLAHLFRIMQINWRMTTKDFQTFTLDLKNKANVYGLSFGKIMNDVTANAENLSLYFAGSTKRLTEAVISAQMLGTTLSNQVQITKGFSRWADAIQKSFVLSSITMTSFNAASLYTKSVFGDIKGTTDEILNNLAKSKDRWMGVVPLMETAAQTLGVSVEEMRTMVENKELQNILGQGFGKNLPLAVRAVRDMASETGKSYVDIAKNLGQYGGDITTRIGKYQIEEKKLADQFSVFTKTGEEFAELIGLKDTIDPLTKIQLQVVGILYKIATSVSKIANSWLFGGAEIVYDQKYVDSLIRKQELKAGGGTLGLGTNWRAQAGLAGGGIATRPIVAGERGPEAILPFTGSGVQGFTVPFIGEIVKNVVTQVMNELNKNTNSKPLEVNVYLDSDVLAEKIERHNLKVAMR